MIPFTCPCCLVGCPPHLEGCTFHHDCPNEAEDFDEVSALRAEIAHLREERRWISVEERLPECEVEVLVAMRGCEFPAIGWREHRAYYIVPETVWTLGDELDRGYPPDNVTHWQPLPGPPEGE